MKTAYHSILRDILLLVPRLLVASFRVLVEQVLSGAARRLRKLSSVPWLAAQLQLDPELIKAARVEAVHTGTATRSRLLIEYADSAAAEGRPSSFFIKSRPPGFGSALFGVLFGLGGNEVRFYREIRRDVPVRTPRVYHSAGNSNNYVMLLEDLAEQGCDFRTLASRCSLEDATRIVAALAKLHGKFWQSPRFGSDLAWVRRFETDRDFRLLNLVRNISVPIAEKKFAHVLPPKIREVIPYLMNNYLRLEQQWAQEPRTLLHGDAHLGNMYFQNGEVGFLDWQVVQYGQGMRDVSYFLINSVPQALRLSHQEELIRHYIGLLDEQGVSLGFETAWRQYRLQSVYAWIAGVVTAPSNFQGEEVVAAGLGRASAALLDLDAIELIRQL
jgi:hypothetical protein